MCSGLIIADMRRTKSLRVMNKVLKIAGISKLHLRLDTGNSQVLCYKSFLINWLRLDNPSCNAKQV